MNTKSKDDADDIEDILDDPFAAFTEWNGEADREAYRAWSESDAEQTAKDKGAASSEPS
jgi:heme-degrading monooxygenase HmoA